MRNLMTRSFLDYAELEAGVADESEDERELSLPEENLHIFIQEQKQIQNEMENIRNRLALLRATNEDIKYAWKRDAMRAARDLIDTHIFEIAKTFRHINEQIQNLERSNTESRFVPGCSEGTPYDRIRTFSTSDLRWRLKDLLLDFHEVKEIIMEDFMKEVGSRYYAVTGEEPSDEVLEKIFAEGKSEEILKTTLYSSGPSKVTETSIKKQESADFLNSIRELHQIFLDLEVLVHSLQVERLHTIESLVRNATSYIEGGTEDLNYANTSQRRSGKWLCSAILLFLVLVLLLVVILLLGYSRIILLNY